LTETHKNLTETHKILSQKLTLKFVRETHKILTETHKILSQIFVLKFVRETHKILWEYPQKFDLKFTSKFVRVTHKILTETHKILSQKFTLKFVGRTHKILRETHKILTSKFVRGPHKNLTEKPQNFDRKCIPYFNPRSQIWNIIKLRYWCHNFDRNPQNLTENLGHPIFLVEVKIMAGTPHNFDTNSTKIGHENTLRINPRSHNRGLKECGICVKMLTQIPHILCDTPNRYEFLTPEVKTLLAARSLIVFQKEHQEI